MTSDPLLAEMQRAAFVAWIVTGVSGMLAGASLWFAFRAVARRTHMRVVSAIVAIIVGVGVFAALTTLRYRIEELPFEPPAWIEPGFLSMYLPAIAIVVGAGIAARFTRQVAAR
jgi:hypothetical protein